MEFGYKTIQELYNIKEGSIQAELFFLGEGYFVGTIGLDEEALGRYLKYQENEERKEEDQGSNLGLFEFS